MQVETPAGETLWLSYGMNVHAGGDVAALERALDETLPRVRSALGVTGPFGLALRFDAATVHTLDGDAQAVAALAERLAADGFVPFTGNAFVLGGFHGQALKDAVYDPPWGHPDRTAYTLAFARVLAALAPASAGTLSLSTAPGGWRGWRRSPGQERAAADALREVAAGLFELEQTTGRRVRLGLEPEPRCTLETTPEVIDFIERSVRSAMDERLTPYIGVCYDVCHQAVMHEDPDDALDALAAEEIEIVKVQASSALELRDPRDAAARAHLASFDEPTYLHQVGARTSSGRVQMAEDLAAVLHDPSARWLDWAPWRVHFHVPIFRETLMGGLHSTQADLKRVLARVAAGGITPHVEVETYTFDVLPEAEREAGSGHDLAACLARELAWARDELTGGS